jgi:hypothetical protein
MKILLRTLVFVLKPLLQLLPSNLLVLVSSKFV